MRRLGAANISATWHELLSGTGAQLLCPPGNSKKKANPCNSNIRALCVVDVKRAAREDYQWANDAEMRKL